MLFAGFPLLWVLGLGAFAVALCALPMTVLLVLRGATAIPRVFALWGAFFVCALASVVMVGGLDKFVGYGMRLLNYAGAGIVFLYVFNSARSPLTDRRILATMFVYLLTLVGGGWLGVLFPDGRISSVIGRVLPASIGSNEYVDALVNPTFAEVQHPWGSPEVFVRPAAPLPYTNGWGLNFSLMLFFSFAMIVAFRSAWSRAMVGCTVAAGLFPALQTGNRGMLLACAVFIAYGVIRFALRGRIGPLVALTAVGLITTALALPTVVTNLLSSRLAYSESNSTRTSVYWESFQGALRSPLLGNGGPQEIPQLDVSVGTQGQLWNIMFSYGFIALVLFVAWFAAAAWLTRRAANGTRLWLHVAACVPLLTMFYYGFDGPQLAIAMVAIATAMRPADLESASPSREGGRKPSTAIAVGPT